MSDDVNAGSDQSVEAMTGLRSALTARFIEGEPVSDPQSRVADATRSVIDELMRTTASEDDLERARALVDIAASLLREKSHGREYTDAAEGSLADGRQAFLDFSPFIGRMNPLAPPITISFDDDGNVVGRCVYGVPYEGPPGCLHGGFIAAGFDEVLGFAQGQSGRPGMTARLTINYRSPTPLYREVRYVGRLDRVDGRKIYASATLSDGDRLCAEAEGLFVSMRPDVFDRLLQMRIGDGQPPTGRG